MQVGVGWRVPKAHHGSGGDCGFGPAMGWLIRTYYIRRGPDGPTTAAVLVGGRVVRAKKTRNLLALARTQVC